MTWAKAPTFATDPAVRRRIDEETEADRRRFLGDGLSPVHCGQCGTCVLVKKSSANQTSIQWTEDASRCPELADAPHTPGLADTCGKLRDAIDRAVVDGLIEVPDA
jgi:hypothetical protein